MTEHLHSAKVLQMTSGERPGKISYDADVVISPDGKVLKNRFGNSYQDNLKKFTVMVTERYLITQTHDVMAEDEDAAREKAEELGTGRLNYKDFKDRLEFEDCESYIMNDASIV